MLNNQNIAVLITCHNRKEKTVACLAALYQCTVPVNYSLDIFLVDDGSTDGTAAAIKREFPDVQIIQGDGNLYWNRGMHLAWSEAIKNKKDFDYYLWLNDDVVLYDDAVSHILDCVYESDSTAIVCGILETSQFSSKISYGGGNKIKGSYYLNQPSTVLQSCDIMNGNFVIIPRAIFEVVGLIDPIFPHSMGDHDYALRAKKLGFTTFTTKKFVGYCELNPSNPKWCLPEVKLKNRIQSLYSPLGNSHPYYYFIYEKRHFGVYTALKHFISIHLRLLIPQLWK